MPGCRRTGRGHGGAGHASMQEDRGRGGAGGVEEPGAPACRRRTGGVGLTGVKGSRRMTAGVGLTGSNWSQPAVWRRLGLRTGGWCMQAGTVADWAASCGQGQQAGWRCSTGVDLELWAQRVVVMESFVHENASILVFLGAKRHLFSSMPTKTITLT
jgi:hypothetical protein